MAHEEPSGARRSGLGRRMRGWLPRSRAHWLTLAALVALLVGGAVVRALLYVAWRPGFFGWPDAYSYIHVARTGLFSNVLRPAGTPLFLRGLHLISHDLTFTVGVNHVLGLTSAIVLYLAVVRTGAPRALGLVPAAIVALNGDTAFLEHSALSEPLFISLIALALYAGVRALERASPWWAGAAGLLFAVATTVRTVALPLLPLVVLWLMLVLRVPLRRRLVAAVAAGLAIIAVIGGYYVAEYASIHKTGFSRHGIWNLYGRVAPFANCKKFTPPKGTAGLCERTPRSQRYVAEVYMFYYVSPAIRAFGDPFTTSDANTRKVGAFTRAVIIHQPLDYLSEVGLSMLRYVAPESWKGVGGGPSYWDLVHEPILFNPWFQEPGRIEGNKYYDDANRFWVDWPMVEHLRDYETVTRVDKALFAVLALLSFAAPFVTRGRQRASAVLFTVVAWTLLFVPVATVMFSARTSVPGFGPLAAAGALGGWGVWCLARRRGRPGGKERSAVAEPAENGSGEPVGAPAPVASNGAAVA